MTRSSCTRRPAPTWCGRSTTRGAAGRLLGLRGGGHPGDGQPTPGAQPHRRSLGGGLVGGGPTHPVPELPGCPPRARRHRRGVRARPEPRCGWCAPTSAAASGPRPARPPSCCCWASCPGGSDDRCGGSRPAARTWWPWATAGPSARWPRWAAPATVGSPPTSSTVVQDSGAYPAMGAVLPFMTRMMTTGVYEMGDVEFSAVSVVTNTTPLVAYRGAGRPEAAAALERMIDRFATEIGLDPAEVRRRNLLPPDVFPFTTPTGTEYDSGDYARALDLLLETAGYDELRAEQARRRARRRPDAARHRPGRLRRGDRRWRRVRRGPAAARRHGAGQDRLQPLRPGPPHGLGHAGQRPPRHPHGSDRGRPRRHRRHPQRGGHRRLAIGAAGRRRGARRRRQAARAGPPAGRRPARGRPGRRRARRAARGASTWPARPSIGLGWEELAVEGEDPLAGLSDLAEAKATFPFGAHLAVVEIDRETGRGASWCGSWPSTTPA